MRGYSDGDCDGDGDGNGDGWGVYTRENHREFFELVNDLCEE